MYTSMDKREIPRKFKFLLSCQLPETFHKKTTIQSREEHIKRVIKSRHVTPWFHENGS